MCGLMDRNDKTLTTRTTLLLFIRFVDLSLRLRTPTTPLEIRQQEMIRQVDQWCLDYESKIRSLGGNSIRILLLQSS